MARAPATHEATGAFFRRRRNQVWFLVISLVVVVGGMFYFLFLPLNAPELRDDAKALMAKDEREIEASLGPPRRRMTKSEYEQVRPDIATSFEPDPPQVDCDVVYEYIVGLRIALIYVRGGKVVGVYTGLT